MNGVKPELRSGKYGKALEKLVVEVGLVLASDCEKTGDCVDNDASPWWMPYMGVGVFGAIFAFILRQSRQQQQQQRDVSSKLRRLQKDLKVLPSSFAPTPLADHLMKSNRVASPPAVVTVHS